MQWAVAPDGGAAVGEMGFEWSPAGLTAGDRRNLISDAMGDIMRLPMTQRRGPLFAAMFARGRARRCNAT